MDIAFNCTNSFKYEKRPENPNFVNYVLFTLELLEQRKD